jgi:Cu(I)/Ag(I) efflux system membrane protein CusA/SilA
MRRGVGELDGIGEAVGGVVISRFGENAFKVIATPRPSSPSSKTVCRPASSSRRPTTARP